MKDAAAPEIAALYARAFRDFGTLALWNLRPAEHPTEADALAITAALRTHGRMEGQWLAERIELACRRWVSAQSGAYPSTFIRHTPQPSGNRPCAVFPHTQPCDDPRTSR